MSRTLLANGYVVGFVLQISSMSSTIPDLRVEFEKTSDMVVSGIEYRLSPPEGGLTMFDYVAVVTAVQPVEPFVFT